MSKTEVDNAAPEAGEAPPQPRRTLPALLDHFNANDLKVFFRCWAAAWVMSLLIFVGPSLRNIGTATFFGAIVLFVVPPTGILLVYLLASLSLLGGMCLAWAWGLLTLKAALAARPSAQTMAQYQALRQLAGAQAQQSGQNATLIGVKLVHDGLMLDTRITVIIFVMCCVFIYTLARVRANNPKLLLTQLFGTIAIDIFLLVGPTLPTFNAKLAQVLVKPGAIGIGLGFACCLLLFPQSTSYAVLGKMEKLLRLAEVPLDATRKCFTNHPVAIEQLRAARGNAINLFKAMQPEVAFLPLDFSRGRWNAEDVKSLQDRASETMVAGLSLLDFHIARAAGKEKMEKAEAEKRQQSSHGTTSDKEDQALENKELMDALETPEESTMRSNLREALKDTTADLLDSCSQSIKLASDCIHAVNTTRWNFASSSQRFDKLTGELGETLDNLKLTRASCITNTTEAILNQHADLFDEQGQFKIAQNIGPDTLRGVVLSMVIEERIFGAAVTIEAVLEHMLQLMKARTQLRIWAPTRLQYALSWIFNGKAVVPVAGVTPANDDDPDVVEEQTTEARRRLRVSQGHGFPAPKNIVTRAIVATYRWFTSAAGSYAARMVIVTIATSIPAVLPHTAGFFYREKGIWAVITAQTCMLLYMADFTFSLVSRALGTLFGGLLGVAAWYIGSGSGNGNPYGLAASTAVVTALLMWLRIFLSPAFAQAIIMASATFVLVIGFSYDEHHIAQYGLPGIGYVALWKRLVTVFLGFAAAFIVQIFPKPPSATRHVCKSLANTVRTLADHYALLLSHWNKTHLSAPVGAAAEKISLEVAESLLSLDAAIALLKVEVSMGPFDQKVLKATQIQCQNMNQALGKLLVLLTSLPKELQDRLVRTSGILDDVVVGNVMAVLAIVEQSLRTGAPLPERLPAPLVKSCFETWYEGHRNTELSTTLVRDGNYRRYCVALSSYIRFLSAVDDLVVVLKGALGESHAILDWQPDVEAGGLNELRK